MYFIEIVTLKRSHLWSFFQGHAWLRLVNPAGEILSVGFFGERPITSLWQVIRHLIPRKGRILSPDLYELASSREDQRVTRLALDERRYQQALAFIEGLSLSQKCSFQLLGIVTGNNCAGFVKAVLNHIGVSIKTSHLCLPEDIIAWQNSMEDGL